MINDLRFISIKAYDTKDIKDLFLDTHSFYMQIKQHHLLYKVFTYQINYTIISSFNQDTDQLIGFCIDKTIKGNKDITIII